MKCLWRLLTATFWIVTALALFVVGWIFSGGQFDTVFSVVLLYVALFGIAAGIVQGIVAMVGHRWEKTSDTDSDDTGNRE